MMRTRTIYFAVALLAAALSLGSPARAADAASSGGTAPLQVFVSIPPQEYFVERVGGSLVKATALIGPGQNPHTFEPTPKQIAQLGQARFYFSIGMPFEQQLLKKITAAYKDLRIVDMAQGVPLRAMTAAEQAAEHGEHEPAAAHEHDDAHEREHEHAAGEPDPHVWLNPRHVKIMARNIRAALAQADAAHAADYDANLKAFEADLDRVDARIAVSLAPLKGRDFLVFHPAFGYFGDAYGLRQVAVETGGKEPSARQLAELIARANRDGVKVVFVQPQFSTKSAEAIARAIGGAVVPLDDLARDYLKNLEDMAAKLEEALRTSQ